MTTFDDQLRPLTQVTIREAKSHLARLIEKVLQGETVVIAKRDMPLVRMERIIQPVTKRHVGGLKGIVKRLSDDLDNSIPDMAARMNKIARY
jgi:antitoxin (DNA-binding transcriptional repressor) of toxin-antitoxin stability system